MKKLVGYLEPSHHALHRFIAEFKLIPASHDFCHLLSHLLMFLDSLYGEQYRPRSDFPGSSLVMGYIVYFHDKISSEVHLNICFICRSKNVFHD